MGSENLKSMVETADLLHRTLRKLVVTDRGVHAETIIASAARMSGTMLYRSISPRFGHLPPGSVLLAGESKRHGPMLVDTMFATLKQLGHHEIDEQGLGGARQTTALSRLSLAETREILEPWFRRIKEPHGLSYREIAGATAMTTALLIHECESVLDVHAGCAIAVHGMVEALRTVPHPVAAPG